MSAPLCPNENHATSVLAVARVTYPDGRYRPTTGCAGCVEWLFQNAMAEGRPLHVEPIPEAYGTCPDCHGRVRLRPSGLIRAHRDMWRTCAGRGKKPGGQQ